MRPYIEVKDIIEVCWSANAKTRPTAAKVGFAGAWGLGPGAWGMKPGVWGSACFIARERDRDASACMRRHQAFALAPVVWHFLIKGCVGWIQRQNGSG